MRLVRNTGSDRLADLLRRQLRPGRQLCVVTDKLSLAAFQALRAGLRGYLHSMIDATKSAHEQVIVQSETERAFAEDLERNEAIKVYAKLPGWFQIPTPLGPYNPDWALLVDKPEGERLYLVVETKSSLFVDDLRERESGKIACGKAHFQALAVGENPAHFLPARSLEEVLAFEPKDV